MKGAHEARAQGRPQVATMKEAERSEAMKGAKHIARAKRRLPAVQAESSVGLRLGRMRRMGARR